VRKADNLPLFCAVVTKSGSLNFLEPSAPLQACNGTALPLPLLLHQPVILFIYFFLFVRYSIVHASSDKIPLGTAV